MINNKIKILLATLMLIPIFAMTAASASADFNPLDNACKSNGASGANNPANSPLCKDAAAQGKTNPVSGRKGIINKAANIIALVAGIGAIIMILIGGFEFVTAGGTGFKSAAGSAAPTKAAKARARVSSALIGLVVVALAWTIVRLITDRVIK